MYYMPENLPELKGARFLRSGLLLGELKKKRFEPSQALAMNLKMEEYAHTLNLSSDDDRLNQFFTFPSNASIHSSYVDCLS